MTQDPATRATGVDGQTRITSVRDLVAGLSSKDAFLVMVRGPELGRRITLNDDDSVTIGRDPESTIPLKHDSISRYHAKIEPFEGGHRVVDNMSTNGTYRNQHQVDGSALLSSGDYVQVGDTILKYLSGDNIEAAFHEEIYRLTIEDSLTQIANKRALNEFLDKEFARAKRYQRDLSVIMVDLDHYKRVNDSYGHLMGDFVLRELAKIIGSRIRKDEMFARYGGEEFCIVLPEMNRDKGAPFAETLRGLIAAHSFEFEGTVLKLTASLGVAELVPEMGRYDDLVALADENLYRAKREGRNRVAS